MRQWRQRLERLGTRFPVGKRWKALRASLWVCSALLVLTAAAFPLGTGTHGWTFSSSMGYFLSLFSLLWLWTALALPFAVRWMGARLRMKNSLFRKQALAFTVVSILPLGHLAAVAGVVAFLCRQGGLQLSDHKWVWGYLAFGYVALTAFAVFLMARDLAGRISDSLRVISNGMQMASRLDFDHPIVTVERDEVGRLSDTFTNMSQVVKTRVNLLQALFNNVRIFSGLLSVEKILDHTLKTFRSLEEASEIVVALWDEEGGKLEVVRTSQNRPEVMGLRFAPGEGLFGRVLRDHQFLACPGEDYLKIARGCGAEERLWGKPDYVVAIPMMFKGTLKGAIALYDLSLGDFRLDAKAEYLQGLANQVSIFLENARLYGLVIRDRLTGLYVHSFIEAELENLLAQARRYKFPVSFLMLDVDKFKSINDQYGHAAGNQLLVSLANALKSVSRDADLPARYGGDEFEIVLPHTDKEGGRVYAEKLRKAVEETELEIAPGVKVKVTVSVGLATYPHDAPTSAQLQEAADSALYGAKALGRNCIVLYQTSASIR